MINRALMGVLGSVPVERVTVTATAHRPRVLAYHGIDDVTAFERQLQILRSRYEVIGPEDFLHRAHSGYGGSSRRPPVLITFDDGSPTVIQHALPLLNRYGFKAVMFICPALVDTTDGYWWQVVERAVQSKVADDALGELGLGEVRTEGAAVTALKRLDNGLRRALVTDLECRLKDLGDEQSTWRQLHVEDVHVWVNGGHAVGNHTWDHPILPTCTAAEQHRQVGEAHDWLTDLLGRPPVLFAYPNGDWASGAEDRLRQLGYRGAFLFDHRLNRTTLHPLRISRLRVDASAGRQRFRAISSGIHSAVFHRVHS